MIQVLGPATPTRDAIIWENAPTANYGSRNSGLVGWPFTGQRSRHVLAWSVASIKPRSTIHAAILILPTLATTLTAPQPCRVNALTRMFTEGTENGGTTNTGVTWNKYNSAAEGGNNWTTAGGDLDSSVSATFFSPTSVVPVLVDVTAVVRLAMAQYQFNGLIGLIVLADTLLNENKVWTPWLREAATVANRPSLMIVYSEPPILGNRNPTVSIRRRHDVEPGLSVAFYGDLTRASNADGLPGGGSPDYASALASGIPLWPFGQRSMYGGGYCHHPFARPGMASARGVGFAAAGYAMGGYCVPTSPLNWQVPFPLRDGDYVFGIRLADRLGNEATTPAMEVALTIAALPRPAVDARLESYDAGTKMIGVAWQASPDVEEI